MAESETGELIDPFGGAEDLRRRLLRHVSPAFVEDPVRVLRAARFVARYHHLGFSIASETQELMRTMVANQEVSALVPERVWLEFSKALKERDPQQFFVVLQSIGALALLTPSLHRALLQEPERLQQLQYAAQEQASEEVRWGVLTSGLSDETLKKELRVPSEWIDLTRLSSMLRQNLSGVLTLPAGLVLHILEKLDAFRRAPRFFKLLEIETLRRYPEMFAEQDILLRAQKAASCVIVDEQAKGLPGPKIAEYLREKRLKAINDAIH